MTTALRDFLEIPYDKLEEMNLQAKADRLARKDAGKIQEARMKYLTDERRIKAVTVCFTDLEGRLHMCVSGCPYKKIYYNWKSGKAEKCIFCYPRIEAGQPTHAA